MTTAERNAASMSSAMTPGGALELASCPVTSTAMIERALSGSMLLKPPKRRSREEMPPLKNEKLIKAYHRLRNSWQYEVTGKVATAAVLSHLKAQRVRFGGPAGIMELGRSLVREHLLEDTFYVYDLGNVTRLFKAWRAAMPRVLPFYAVKCNPEPALLKLLFSLGAGFDCASKGELDAVLQLGVPRSKIIFAHPCKRACDMRYAAQAGVQLTTFDTISELHKIAAGCPAIGCVLRLRCDDPDAKVPLGLKYGAQPEEACGLLETAQQLGLEVVGVSFHVGSGCQNLAAFSAAIEKAREVFDTAAKLGISSMRLLDIGGGFTGRFDEAGHVVFGEIARTINSALAAHFPPDCGVRVIAEPGRFFAETSAMLFTPVYGVRERQLPSGGVHMDYWLTDGVYGSFNCILYDDQKPQPHVVAGASSSGLAWGMRTQLRSSRSQITVEPGAAANRRASRSQVSDGGAAPGAEAETLPSTLWGPTCDSMDYIYKDMQLPRMAMGDWLMFPRTGAYTIAGACDFNGICMTQPHKFFVFSDSAVDAPTADSDDEDSCLEDEEDDEAALYDSDDEQGQQQS